MNSIINIEEEEEEEEEKEKEQRKDSINCPNEGLIFLDNDI